MCPQVVVPATFGLVVDLDALGRIHPIQPGECTESDPVPLTVVDGSDPPGGDGVLLARQAPGVERVVAGLRLLGPERRPVCPRPLLAERPEGCTTLPLQSAVVGGPPFGNRLPVLVGLPLLGVPPARRSPLP